MATPTVADYLKLARWRLAAKLIAPVFIGLMVAIPAAHAEKTATGQMSVQERAKKAMALYEEKCRTVAGEKIYKTVPDVEGILLLKVRPRWNENNQVDPMWPGAAFADEASGDWYINSFLGYEENFDQKGPVPITKDRRGYINTSFKPGPKDHPGYRYVDVIGERDGKRYRYTGHWYEPWQEDKTYLKGYIKFSLDKELTTLPPPRYAVAFEDHVIPEERALWVASSTIKVIDTQTNEVLGELTRYTVTGAPSAGNPRPWLRSRACPMHSGASGSKTRMFVDQILIPIDSAR